MKINLLTEVARQYGVLHRGEHDLPDDVANEYLRHGWAELPDGEKPVEPKFTTTKRRK